MRYGVLADIHGNLHALDAAVDRLRRDGVDGWLCAGDLGGYGPHPNECVERVAELGALCVAGNHDLMAVGRLPDRGLPALARETLDWTRTVLSPATRAYLEQLPPDAVTPDGVIVAHGSLGDPCEYVTSPRAARAALDRASAAHPAAGVLVLGHTHLPMAFGSRRGGMRPADVALREDETLLLNPGSVGQSRERRIAARALVLDLTERTASFHALDYDAAASRRALRDAGLPPEAIHLRPSIAQSVRRRLRR